MPSSKLFTLPLEEDDRDAHQVLHATPKAIRPFAPHKTLTYGIICLIWLGFGILGRDPWKPEETLITAAIAELLRHGTLELSAYGLATYPPLYIALATLTAQSVSHLLPLHEGARLVNVLLLLGGFFFLWKAVALHAGRRAAGMAVLLTVCCFGFIVRAHILNFGVAAFFGMAAALWGAAILADEEKTRINQVFVSGVLIGSGAGFLLLACSALAALPALAALALAKRRQSAVYAVAAACFLPVLLWTVERDNLVTGVEAARFTALPHFAAALKDMLWVAAWSLIPLLPLVGVGWWHTRGIPVPRLMTFCKVAALLAAGTFLGGGNNEEDYYLLLPPLALLGAVWLLKIPDAAARVMDGFAVCIIGVIAVGSLWLVWAGLHWQWGAVVTWLQEEWPGYVLPPTSGVRIAAAAALTLAWLALVSNFGRSNERAVVNWSCGMALVWAVFNLLLVGYVDSGKSYRHAAAAVQTHLGDDCLRAPADKHWFAQLEYFNVPLGGADCRYYLTTQENAAALARIARHPRGEKYYLYRRF